MRVLIVLAALTLLGGCAVGWPDTALYEGIPQPEGPGSNSTNPADRPTNVMLRQRTQRLFPAGSPEAPLLDWLATQKMSVRRYPDQDGGVRGSGVRYLGSWPCNRSVRVTWTASSTGVIETITADEGDTGCF
ncbi:hypothetical protein [Brevundimonas sp. FT23028]|uniref:hypothetical protein n=1 Tax=Brevundimonas sp. FT23028 TaxID=3393748 RepID=UPI003B58867A